MKKMYKSLLILIVAFGISASGYAAQEIVKTMSLGDGISTSGVVRLVVKLADDVIGPDMGITLHEAEPAAPWNDAMAISMFDFAKNANGGIYLAGYNAGDWDWETNVKPVEKNKAIAIWITIDAVNQTHGLSAQMEGEAGVTTIFSDYGDRESIKGANTATIAKFCSVFVNDRDGQSASGIEILKDAEIVASIDAFDFSSFVSGVSTEKTAASISVYPTLVDDMLNIATDDVISNIKIFSLAGQEVFKGAISKEISVAELISGTYIVEVKTMNNQVSRQKIIKK